MVSYEGKEDYIFISYSHKDDKKVLPVIRRLADDGFRVWYDEGIEAGEEWPEIVADHLGRCALFISFISGSYLDSYNCKREIDYAVSKRRPFISVMLEDVKMTPGMEMQLSSVQSLLWYRMKNDEFISRLYQSEMIASCRRLPDNAPGGTEKSETAKQESRKTEKKDRKAKTGSEKPGTRRMSALRIAGFIAAVLVLTIAIRIVSNRISSVNIHGTQIDSMGSFITLENTALSASDLREFAGMERLTSLTLEGCDFPDGADALSDLPISVRTLKFRNCTGITDYSFISKIAQITSLELNGCNLSDADLASIDFTGLYLRDLWIENNSDITDLTPIISCTGLTDVRLSGCSVTSLAPLAKMEGLACVTADGNKLTDLEGLRDKEDLKEIRCDNNQLKDLDELVSSYRLQKISAAGNSLESADGLSSCTALEVVDLHDNKLSDVSLLAQSASTLGKVDLRSNDIEDLSWASGMSVLTEMYIDNNRIKDISPLASSAALHTLSCSNNGITGADVLSKLPELSFADLSGNQISGQVSLENNPKLSSILLQHNRINSLSYSSENRAEAMGAVFRIKKIVAYDNPLFEIKDVYEPETEADETKIDDGYFDYPVKDEAESAGYAYDPYMGASQFYRPHVTNCPYDERINYEKENSQADFVNAEELDEQFKDKYEKGVSFLL